MHSSGLSREDLVNHMWGVEQLISLKTRVEGYVAALKKQHAEFSSSDEARNRETWAAELFEMGIALEKAEGMLYGEGL